MQLLQYRNEFSKLLYYIQRFGDLNPSIIGAISGIKNSRKLISELKSKYTFRAYPFVRESTLGLKKYVATLYFKKYISLKDINYIFDSTLNYAMRDLLKPNVLNLSIYYNSGANFIRVLENLIDQGLIYYYEVNKVEDISIYPFDYSLFNYDLKEFEGIGEKERIPFELPDLSDDFKPDYYDIVIIGKKQARTVFSLKDISSFFKIPFKEALRHYQGHVIGKGLISAYIVTLTIPDYRLLVKFKNEDVLKYLTRIPEFYFTYKLDDGSYIGHILGRNSMLIKYLEFISEARRKFDDDITVNIHPADKDHIYIASIPYEHYENGKWEFNPEVMIMRAEKIAS